MAVSSNGPTAVVPGASPKIKILFLGANPSDTTKLALETEFDAIKQRLDESEHADRFVLVMEWQVRVGHLQKALLQHRPDILHFSGHGLGDRPTDAVGDTRNLPRPEAARPRQGIVVEDDQQKSVQIAPEALEALLGIVGGIRCVVLNACYSGSQAAALAKRVDCVIGMSDAINDKSAIAFAWAFYQGLGFGSKLSRAFALGRNQIALEHLPGSDVPMIIMADDIVIAAVPTTLVAGASVQPEGSGRWISAVVTAVCLAGIGGAVAYGSKACGATGKTDGSVPPDAPSDVIDDGRPPSDAPSGMVWIPPADAKLGTPATVLQQLRATCTKAMGAEPCGLIAGTGYAGREAPRSVHVHGFFLDRTEVTTTAFATWLRAQRDHVRVHDKSIELDHRVVASAAGTIELNKDGASALEGYEGIAMSLVTWEGAFAYCISRGATLPTGDQWERAARGTIQTLFPWGDAEPACSDSVLARHNAGDPKPFATCPGAWHPEAPETAPRDVTPEGVADLVGNVSEWVLDADPAGHYVRGGSYASPWYFARPAAHMAWRDAKLDVGFRCALTPARAAGDR